jgi:hypothetical protein
MTDPTRDDARAEDYDARVVAALRAVVLDDASARGEQPVADELARRRPGRAPWALAAAAAAVLVGGLVVVPTLRAQPAWAVSRNGAGDVEVEVNRFDDAAGLEAALAAEGVPADVTFLPDGTWCAPGRYDPDDDRTPSRTTVSVGARSFAARVSAGAVPSGSVLVITASARSMTTSELEALDEDPDDDAQTVSGTTSRVGFVVVAGPVAPCEPVSVPPLGSDWAPPEW